MCAAPHGNPAERIQRQQHGHVHRSHPSRGWQLRDDDHDEVVTGTPKLLWSMPLEGDEVAALMIDDRGQLAVSTSRERMEPREGGFDAMESIASRTPRGDLEHHNLYSHRSYGFDTSGRVAWEHDKVRVARAIPEGWATLTDRHDLVVIDPQGVTKRGRRLTGESWRICGWRACEPIVSSDPESTWVAPYIYSARDRQLQVADEGGRLLRAIDLIRTPFDDECRRDPPPPGLPASFLVPTHMRLISHRARGALIATHRLHMAWIASLTLDGDVSWVRLVDHACCNSACVVGEHIAHTTSCGNKVTLLAGDGRVLARRNVPRLLDAVPDDGDGFCMRTLDGVCGFDKNLEPTWALSTDGIPHVKVRDRTVYVVAGPRSKLALSAYALA